ncbi:MAG: DsbE family thiol:disulfide interchange protein [Pseudomonadota bacterium]
MKKFLTFLPLLIFAVIASYFYLGLGRDKDTLPSALIDKPIPQFALPALDDASKILSRDIVQGDGITLINFFASWCVPCRAEHPQLLALQRMQDDLGLRLIGIAWKNKRDEAQQFLQELGNPFAITLHDEKGRTGIDFGVYGLPETYVIDQAGHIRYRHVGPILPETLRDRILPVIKSLGAS